ncbi:cytochrome d ubiquinol oxidase subunit II [Candidatus Sororendozoicomonas aggregata]|uniref:cytochrome d ubiquinol oxidase subunit II n=1 Tax=Candidatus Sororendozoicomonas aggregata TaxID=3073239 RepID=UPI002ED00FCD
MVEYETLKLIWWVLIGVLLIGFVITDGFDIGTANLLPVIGKTNNDRRIMINAIAPHWDGNQVWLITAGGALFAAWPMVYATAFSGFYWAMILTLFALLIRPMALDYRAKIDNPRWRSACDWGLFTSGAVPSLIFGVAFGNLFQGFGFEFDELMRSHFSDSFFDLLNPFGLLCGVISLTMISMQGASWQALRSGAPVQERAAKMARLLAVVTIITFAIAGVWVAGMPGFEITSAIDPNAAATPLSKTVTVVESGRWISNYSEYPWTLIAPVLGFSGSVGVLLLATTRFHVLTFISSSLAQAGIIMTAGFSLFPFVMPSSSMPSASLTVWDAVSSHLTLGIMTIIAFIFVPLVLAYTSWCFYKMWGRVHGEDIAKNTHAY